MKKDSRIQIILNQIVKFSKGDFSGYIKVSEKVDAIDAISAGLNALGDILNTERAQGYSGFQIATSEEAMGEESNAAAVVDARVWESSVHPGGTCQSNLIPMLITDANAVHILEVNDAAVRQYGHSREEFLSLTVFDILARDEQCSQQRFTGPPDQGIGRHIRKDGSIIYVQWMICGMVFQAQAARLILVNDVTDQKIAEDALRLSEKIFKGVFNSPLIGLVVWSTEEGVIEANDLYLQMSGYSKSDLVEGKMEWQQLAPVASVGRGTTTSRRITSCGGPAEVEYMRKDGSVLPVLIGTADMEDGMRVSYMISISQQKNKAREIYLLNRSLEQSVKERAEELHTAQKELETFSRAISHDLRAPLRALHGYSQILVDDYSKKLDANGVRLLSNVKTNAKKMGQMVEDLLTFSRAGKRTLNRSIIRMNSIVESILAGLNNLDNVSMNIHDLGSEAVDPSLLQLAFQNLIINALKYSGKRDKPVVEIGMRYEDGSKIYFIKDNGAGFDMRYYDKLFGVFQRLHSEDEFAGTGVGLALTQRIIFRHGGRIWAEGKINEGAIFYFTLNSNPRNE